MEKLSVVVAHFMAQLLKEETCEEMEAAEGETVEDEALWHVPKILSWSGQGLTIHRPLGHLLSHHLG